MAEIAEQITIGLLGGMNWESTVGYYRMIGGKPALLGATAEKSGRSQHIGSTVQHALTGNDIGSIT